MRNDQDDEESPGQDSPAESVGAEADPERIARERDEYLANWKRAAADYQNLRRRLQGDIDTAVARRKAALLSDLLLVLDYLDLALQTPVRSDEGRSLHAGVEATRAALLGALEREGVKPIPDGGRFDPALHDSVARGDPAEGEPGEILATLRRGYTAEGKTLRPAQVRVVTESPEKPETD